MLLATRSSLALQLSVFSCFLFAAAEAKAASQTAPLPAVVAVNREIGLSVTGNFSELTRSIGHNYSERPAGLTPVNFFGYDAFRSDRTHSNGWVPGFRADAQYMFDTSVLKHLYVATSFNLGDGDVYYGSRTRVNIAPVNGTPFTNRGRYDGQENRSTINVTGEIGKGFLLLHDRLLVMPTAQGGYVAGGYESFTSYGKGFVGMALHVDYAITDRLVIRGRGGWAQILDSHGYFTDYNANLRHASRPEWSGDIGLDYRVTQRIHITGGVRYTYFNYGRAKGSVVYTSHPVSEIITGRACSWRNSVQLRLGVAYQL